MEKTPDFNSNEALSNTWFLIGLYLIIPLCIIFFSLWNSYRLEHVFQQQLIERDPELIGKGMMSIYSMNFFNWVALAFLLALIFISVPAIRKILGSPNLSDQETDKTEVDKVQKKSRSEDANAFIKALCNQAPVGLHATNEEGLIVEINQTELNWFGYEYEEVVGKKKYWELLKFEYPKEGFEKLADLREQGSLRNIETSLTTKTGKVIPVLINANVVYDAHGVFIGSHTVVFNFEERKKLEEAVQRKQMEADRLGLLKSQFIANISHEIRTPLNAIIGFTQLLRRSVLNEKQKEFVGSIHQSSENLLVIVNDILDFSRIEAGVFRLKSVPFNLPELLLSVENTFNHKAKEKKLAFSVEMADDLPEILQGDPTRLVQILNNLLSNAIKFTERGSVRVSVDVAEQTAGQVSIRFTVSDTGIGIPEDQLEAIFDRFGQIAADTTRKYGGTGLGLTISRQLAVLQKGDITVQSEVGVGSIFTLLLPYQVSDNGVSNETSQQGPARMDPLPGVRILIVEDNPMNQRIAELLLDDWGFSHDHAPNGKVALKMLRNKTYDLVLMDIQLPELDGYMATRKIRKELGLEVPIIATTAQAFNGEREKCINSGMNDYISKPLRETKLLALIKKYIPKNKQESKAEITGTWKSDLPGFDRSYILEITQGKPERLVEMAEIFLAQSRNDLQSLEQALKKEKFQQAATVTHSLKSTVNYMGFEATLGRQLQELEQLIRNDPAESESIEDLFTEIKKGIAEAGTFVKSRFLKKE